MVIGKEGSVCDLIPKAIMLSNIQCYLTLSRKSITIRDFNSTNGTTVNRKIIKGVTELKHFDIIGINSCHLIVTLKGIKYKKKIDNLYRVIITKK